MRKRFLARKETRPGDAWLADFAAGRVEAERWYLGQGRSAPAGSQECRTALRRHMPELLPHYDRACAMLGDDDFAHRVISHWRPPAAVHGCTHAIWRGSDGPALVRNYDFPLGFVSPGLESSAWTGREIIAKVQRPWGGCLDGMNADGLAASLAAGGSAAQGEGFSVILMLRYILETCSTVSEATAALIRIPIAASQNVVLLDRSGDHAILYLGPDRDPAVVRRQTCANHQERAASIDSGRRLSTAERALEDEHMTLPGLVSRFMEPPLYSRKAACPTVYTAVYQPVAGTVDYVWPGMVWRQAIGAFMPGDYLHDYGNLTP